MSDSNINTILKVTSLYLDIKWAVKWVDLQYDNEISVHIIWDVCNFWNKHGQPQKAVKCLPCISHYWIVLCIDD